MNKKLKILFLIIISFICTNKVKSFNIASSGISWSLNNGSKCDETNCYSLTNEGKMILQARLYYIDNASFTQIGETYYFVNSNAYNSNELYGINLIYIKAFNDYSGNDKYNQASNYLKNIYFKDNKNVQTYLEKVTKTKEYNEVLTKISNSSKGYRIMIEPAIIYGNPSFGGGNIALITPKGLAQEQMTTDISPTCNNCTPLIGMNSMSQYLYMSSGELGIIYNNHKYTNPKDYCGNIDESKLGDIKIGCGYNLINISDYIKVNCYKMDITGNNLECKKYDKNNEGEYSEIYTELSNCTDQSSADRYKKYGKLYNTNGTCKIYCKEIGKISLPGNVLTPIQRGSYFSWPTQLNDKIGKYKITLSTKLICKITDTGGNVSAISSNFTRKCKTGYVQYEDECRKKTSSSKVCPSGTTEIDGNCYTLSNSINTTPRTTQIITTNNRICKSEWEDTGGNGTTACKKYSYTSYTYACPNGYSGQLEYTTPNIENAKKYRCCPEGYNINYNNTSGCVSENPIVFKGNYTCPNGTDTKQSTCYADKIAIVEYRCSSGGNLSGTNCIKKKEKKCSGGWSPYGRYDCIRPATKTTVYKCPNGYASSGQNSCTAPATKKFEKDMVEDVPMVITKTEKIYDYMSKTECPSGFSKNGSLCQKTISVSPICEQGKLVNINGIQKCATCPSGYNYYNNGICKSNSNYNKVCPWNDGKKYVLINNICYQSTSNTDVSYSCPVNYNISNNNRYCIKQCNKDNLKTTLDSILLTKTPNIKLIGGTDKKIDENLASKTLEQKYDVNTLEYSKTTTFYIRNNKNRYYNRLTDEVSEQKVESKVIFDRQEGVISLNKKDDMLENNLLKKYELKLEINNFGLNNQFGSKITNYVCHYTLTDTPECRCPLGTKNAGDLLSELSKKVCSNKNESCAEMQEKLCNYNPQTDGKISDCNERYICTKNNKDIFDITDCVKEKVKENTFLNAIKICEIENNCSDDKCTGECEELNGTIDNIKYKTIKCNNHYCNFQIYCNEKNKKTSYSSYDCIKEKLKANDILDELNNGITTNKMESAIKSCKKEICASKEKIIFRTIDLINPFPGKNNDKNIKGFSITGKSRIPGYNWNSKTVVKKQILKARGVENYNLYNKQPLYKITLTSSDIKKIREYNKNNKYNDFELKCIDNNSSDCISSFLHSNVIGFNIEGVESCQKLNFSSTKSDFDRCYNSNN